MSVILPDPPKYFKMNRKTRICLWFHNHLARLSQWFINCCDYVSAEEIEKWNAKVSEEVKV